MAVLKSIAVLTLVFFSALGAAALDKPLELEKAKNRPSDLQIFTDLQLVDEVESLNAEEGGKVWLRSSDDDAQDGELKGISLLER